MNEEYIKRLEESNKFLEEVYLRKCEELQEMQSNANKDLERANVKIELLERRIRLHRYADTNINNFYDNIKIHVP